MDGIAQLKRSAVPYVILLRGSSYTVVLSGTHLLPVDGSDNGEEAREEERLFGARRKVRQSNHVFEFGDLSLLEKHPRPPCTRGSAPPSNPRYGLFSWFGYGLQSAAESSASRTLQQCDTSGERCGIIQGTVESLELRSGLLRLCFLPSSLTSFFWIFPLWVCASKVERLLPLQFVSPYRILHPL